MKTKTNNNGGIGIFSVVAIVFLVLKLSGVVNWSWWLVLFPIYFPIIIFILVLFVIVTNAKKNRR